MKFTIKKTKSKFVQAPAVAQRRSPSVAYFTSRKNYYARKEALTVRLHKDGYFRRCDNLPSQILHPRGPGAVESEDKNELRRGLFLRPVSN